MVHRSNANFDYTYNSGGIDNPQIEHASRSPSVGEDFSCSNYLLTNNTYIGNHFWFCGNSLQKKPSGLKSSSVFPVYDVIGNLGEWIQGGILEADELSTDPGDNINVYDHDDGYLQDFVYSYGEQINKIGMDHGQYERFDYSNYGYKTKGHSTGFRLVITLPDTEN